MKKINIKNLVLEYIGLYRKLSDWYGDLRRMNEKRLPINALEWFPLQRRNKERSRNSRIQYCLGLNTHYHTLTHDVELCEKWNATSLL